MTAVCLPGRRARALSRWALALGGMLIASAPVRAENPTLPRPSQAIFAPHLDKPDLPRVEITLTRRGFRGVILVLTRNRVTQEADGFAIYITNETENAGLYCHIWISGAGAKQRFVDIDVIGSDAPITGQAYALMAVLAAEVDGLTRDLAPKSIGLGVIRGVPETVYQQIDAIRAANGGCN
jgi:hypothetical protein